MSFNFMAAVTIRGDFGAPKLKSVTLFLFPFISNNSIVSPVICHEEMGPDAMILVACVLSFKPTSSCSSLTLIKRLFSCSSLSAFRVVSSPYLSLLIFLTTILIPACASSSPAFVILYSAYKLNKQGDNIQLYCTLSQFATSQLFNVRF